MKSKYALFVSIIALLIALTSCTILQETSPKPVENAITSSPELPTEDETEIPVETDVPTATETETVTATEPVTSPLPTSPGPVIFALSMHSTTHGWAVTRDGNSLLVTQDGGETWLDATPPGLHPLPADISSLGIHPFFLNESTAWFSPFTAGTGSLYHTQDGGESWITSAPPFGNARYFFLDENVGYGFVDLGAGAGSHYVALYRTLDGGNTWLEMFTHEPGESKSLPEGGSKNGVTFLDVDNGWVGGSIPMEDYFYLHYTTDGGITWSLETDISLPAAYAGSFLDVWQPVFVDATSAYLQVRAVLSGGDLALLIYRSHDSGDSWVFRNAVVDGNAVDFVSVDEGFAAADSGLFHTTDGGLNWLALLNSGIPAGSVFLKVDFVDSQHGWVITTPDDFTWEPLELYRTEDGGASWVKLLP